MSIYLNLKKQLQVDDAGSGAVSEKNLPPSAELSEEIAADAKIDEEPKENSDSGQDEEPKENSDSGQDEEPKENSDSDQDEEPLYSSAALWSVMAAVGAFIYSNLMLPLALISIACGAYAVYKIRRSGYKTSGLLPAVMAILLSIGAVVIHFWGVEFGIDPAQCLPQPGGG